MRARATSDSFKTGAAWCAGLVLLFTLPIAFGVQAQSVVAGSAKLVTDDWRPKHVNDPLAREIFDKMVLLEGVFDANESNKRILPFMRAHAEFFRGKTMMEIGVGSGINSLYAARLGAKKIVATDIDPAAAECARINAERLGVDSVIDVRLVSPDNMSAYAVIGDDEKFDIIFSNPP